MLLMAIYMIVAIVCLYFILLLFRFKGKMVRFIKNNPELAAVLAEEAEDYFKNRGESNKTYYYPDSNIKLPMKKGIKLYKKEDGGYEVVSYSKIVYDDFPI